MKIRYVDLNQFFKEQVEHVLIYGDCFVIIEHKDGLITQSFINPPTCLGEETKVVCVVESMGAYFKIDKEVV